MNNTKIKIILLLLISSFITSSLKGQYIYLGENSYNEVWVDSKSVSIIPVNSSESYRSLIIKAIVFNMVLVPVSNLWPDSNNISDKGRFYRYIEILKERDAVYRVTGLSQNEIDSIYRDWFFQESERRWEEIEKAKNLKENKDILMKYKGSIFICYVLNKTLAWRGQDGPEVTYPGDFKPALSGTIEEG